MSGGILDGKYEETAAKLLEDIESTHLNLGTVQLNSKSKKVSDNVAGYIVQEAKSLLILMPVVGNKVRQ